MIILSSVSSLIHGWAISTMWGWFIKPVFVNLPTLSILQSVGISLIFTLLQSSISTTIYEINGTVNRNEDSIIRAIESSAKSIFVSVFIVCISWFWHQFII
jgi:hypothetical protein